MVTDEVRIPNIEVLLQLAVKLRAIVLYLLETCKSILQEDRSSNLFVVATFDDLENALRRLTTLKYLVNRYYVFFTPNMSILVAVRSSLPYHSHRLSNLNTNVAGNHSLPTHSSVIELSFRMVDEIQISQTRFEYYSLY